MAELEIIVLFGVFFLFLIMIEALVIGSRLSAILKELRKGNAAAGVQPDMSLTKRLFG